MDFVARINELFKNSPLTYGITPLERPLTIDFYKGWLAKGYQGTMEYLADHAPLKENSQTFAPRAHSALVFLKPYFPHPYPATQLNVRTALYAQGEDYHLHFRQELEQLAKILRDQFPDEEFLCFTDSGPILERDLARRAGLGWVGKNTCLLNSSQGSLFFIGQILTSLKLKSDVPLVPDFCGTCDRCIQACPTQALVEPRVLDARRCISYWTIEAKTEAPADLRAQFGDWLFGCDICQTVCPWNEKVYGREPLSLKPSSPKSHEDLEWILNASHHEIRRQFQNTPLSRARPLTLKRNALTVIANLKINALKNTVEDLILREPRLAEMAKVTLLSLI